MSSGIVLVVAGNTQCNTTLGSHLPLESKVKSFGLMPEGWPKRDKYLFIILLVAAKRAITKNGSHRKPNSEHVDGHHSRHLQDGENDSRRQL